MGSHIVSQRGCAADLDSDYAVGTLDLLLHLAAWGPCRDCGADMNGDGAVDVQDLQELLSAWGACPR